MASGNRELQLVRYIMSYSILSFARKPSNAPNVVISSADPGLRLCPRTGDERCVMPLLALAPGRAPGWKWMDGFMVNNIILSKLWVFFTHRN